MKIGVIGNGSGLLHAQIARELANRDHQPIFISEISDSTCERLGSLEEIIKNHNKAVAKEIYKVRNFDEREFHSPSLQSNNRKARRKADKEAKKHKKQQRKS